MAKPNTLSPVYTVPTECQDCYKCIRRCPVKAIRVENSHAVVMGELCIACGNCVIHCPAHAKHYRNDISLVRALLESKRKTLVSLAPSFRAEFPEYTPAEFTTLLARLGFSGVSETALGADFVSQETSSKLSQGVYKSRQPSQKLYLSSACPAAVEYVKRYMSDFAPYITDCASPLLAHARYLKAHHKGTAVVFVGPCIAKKREADVFDEIDAAITFNELREMLSEAGVTGADAETASRVAVAKSTKTSKNNFAFVTRRAAKAALFPVEGGMISAMRRYNPPKCVRMQAVSGIEEIHDALAGLDVNALEEPLFLELLSCRGGCVNGPGAAQDGPRSLRYMRTVDWAESAAEKLDEKMVAEKPIMAGTIPCEKIEEKIFDENEVHEAMRSVGKYSVADEINCNGCGYETCRNFALALLRGIAEKTMCVSYMRKLAQKQASGFVAACPSGVVTVDKTMSIVDCNRNFAKLMGKDVEALYDIKPGLEGADITGMTESAKLFKAALSPNGPERIDRDVREAKKILHYTIFVVERGETAAGIVEDVTDPKIQRERTITQAQKVIDKNLSTVQQIAFLLGENAAETESMLNSIIESFGDGNSGDEQKNQTEENL